MYIVRSRYSFSQLSAQFSRYIIQHLLILMYLYCANIPILNSKILPGCNIPILNNNNIFPGFNIPIIPITRYYQDAIFLLFSIAKILLGCNILNSRPITPRCFCMPAFHLLPTGHIKRSRRSLGKLAQNHSSLTSMPLFELSF